MRCTRVLRCIRNWPAPRKDDGCLQPVTSFNNRIGEEGRVLTDRECMELMKEKYVLPSRRPGYIPSGRWPAKLVHDLQALHNEGHNVSTETYNVIISFTAKRYPRLTEEILRQMREKKVEMNSDTIRGVMYYFARAGKVEEVEQTFATLQNRFSTTAVEWGFRMLVYLQAKNPAKLFEVFEDMLKAGIKPNISTVSYLIRASPSAEAAYKRFLRMRADYGILPVTRTLNIVMATCASFRDVKYANMAFETAQELRIRPNVVTYNTLALCYAKAKDFEMLEETMKRMSKAGFLPDIHTYENYLRGCSLLVAEPGDRYEKAATAAFDLARSEGIISSFLAYLLMICYATTGNAKRARDLDAYVVSEGLRITERYYNAMRTATMGAPVETDIGSGPLKRLTCQNQYGVWENPMEEVEIIVGIRKRDPYASTRLKEEERCKEARKLDSLELWGRNDEVELKGLKTWEEKRPDEKPRRHRQSMRRPLTFDV
eukprot:Sspe_Gene.101422::Locus_75999_Transcript_1_1_Confidence_1.000_Length_1509::g.101422::m.101422